MAGGYSHTFVESPSEDLRWQCHICQGILRKPVLVTCCGGKFCCACIGEWQGKKKRECPLCRREYDLAPEKDLERVLLNKKVLCSHHDQGCRWRGELRKVEKHENNDCQYVFVNCPYECGGKVLRLNVKAHKEKCPERPQPCEFVVYGCQQIVQFSKKQAHCTSHSQHHLTLVLSELMKKEKELQVVRKDVIGYQTKLCQMEERVRETEDHCRQTEEVLGQMKVEQHREQERCKRTDRCLRQTKEELQQARKDVLASQNRLREKEEQCQDMEEALQQTKEKLHIEEERYKKASECLRQTTRELQKARRSYVAPEKRLHERDHHKKTESLRQPKVKQHPEHKVMEKKLQHTEAELKKAESSVITTQNMLLQKEEQCRRTEENYKKREEEIELLRAVVFALFLWFFYNFYNYKS